MKYEQTKAIEICKLFGWDRNSDSTTFNLLIIKVKEIIRDTRHACADNVSEIDVLCQVGQNAGKVQNAIINTNLK